MAKGRNRPSARRPLASAELAGLLRLADDLLAAPDSKTAGQVLVDSVVGMYGFPRAVLLAAPDDRLPVLASHGLGDVEELSGPCRSAAVSRALTKGSSRMLRGLDEAVEPWLAQLLPQGGEAMLVPVTADGRRVGALLVQLPSLREPEWQRGLVEPLERAAQCTGRALRTLWRMEHLERLAATDDLTMIANRRTFLASLERELARGARSGEAVSLVILDLDNFKAVNDLHGHPAGDEALRNVAAALSIVCRDLDTPARYGGEEFAVILPDCGPDRCLDIAERLRQAVAAAPAVMPLTASAGAASYPAHAGDVDGLVRAADDALLVSKRAGRNRTTAATGVAPEDALQVEITQRLTLQSGPPDDKRPR